MIERIAVAAALAWLAALAAMLVYGMLGCMGYNGCWSDFGWLAIGVIVSGYGILLPLVLLDSTPATDSEGSP